MINEYIKAIGDLIEEVDLEDRKASLILVGSVLSIIDRLDGELASREKSEWHRDRLSKIEFYLTAAILTPESQDQKTPGEWLEEARISLPLLGSRAGSMLE